MTTITNKWMSILEETVFEYRKVNREINRVTRQVLLRTHSEMYDEPIKIRPFHRYFKPWVSRTAFYNLLEGRADVSSERAIGLLGSDQELRMAVGLEPDHMTEEELCVVRKLIRRNSASVNLLEWLHGTRNLDMSSVPLQASGTTPLEESSSK